MVRGPGDTPMSQIDSTINAFDEYLREGPPRLAHSSATNYRTVIKHVLK